MPETCPRFLQTIPANLRTCSALLPAIRPAQHIRALPPFAGSLSVGRLHPETQIHMTIHHVRRGACYFAARGGYGCIPFAQPQR